MSDVNKCLGLNGVPLRMLQEAACEIAELLARSWSSTQGCMQGWEAACMALERAASCEVC